MTKFWSIEYFDDEGDKCVRHAFMTDEQASALMEEFVSAGVNAVMHDLTPPQAVDARTATVLSADGCAEDSPTRQLGKPSGVDVG